MNTNTEEVHGRSMSREMVRALLQQLADTTNIATVAEIYRCTARRALILVDQLDRNLKAVMAANRELSEQYYETSELNGKLAAQVKYLEQFEPKDKEPAQTATCGRQEKDAEPTEPPQNIRVVIVAERQSDVPQEILDVLAKFGLHT